MTATVVFAPVQVNGKNQVPDTQVVVHVNAKIITATVARRRVNGWLLWDVGDRVLAGDPELLMGEPPYWRVPVHWTSPKLGILAAGVSHLLVDARTGEILEPEKKIAEILCNVKHAARALPWK